MVKIKPNKNEIDYLKDKYENHFLKQFTRTVPNSMIINGYVSREDKEVEGQIYFQHVLESFEKNEESNSHEMLDKDFTNHMNFKLQIARRKSQK